MFNRVLDFFLRPSKAELEQKRRADEQCRGRMLSDVSSGRYASREQRQ